MRQLKAGILPALIMFNWLLAPDSFAQNNSDRVHINVTADVQSSIEMVTISDIQLGSVQPGQHEILINPIRDPGAGSMIARGRPNAEIRIDYDEMQLLRRAGGTETVTFYYQVSGHDENNQYGSELLDGFNRDMAFNADGEFFLWIGGRVNIQNAIRGQYEGEFTIEIEYI